MLSINQTLYGFKVKKTTELEEIKATLYEMEHEKSGAKLLFLDREDDNKTFSIAFKTIPEDSTGVFHIIEHSVLCGSKKYPTKEPFVELLKSSLQTFLNALTFPDKTMYPISSRNDKDYLNLMSVYLDAVLHPAILENPNIFRQEGWHYELDSRDGELTTSGVVLNEMRGAFSSADELASYHLNDMLYPDTCYRHESGGEPSHITDLTYEAFRASHAKYYHPSNARIFLDGSVDLDAALSLIASYLDEYDRIEIDFDIAEQGPIAPVEREVKYEIAPTDTKENRTRLVLGFLGARFDEQKKSLALSVLLDAIASSNESPLKKPILESGLCEDVSISSHDSIKQNCIDIDFKNVADGKKDELIALFFDTVRGLVENGIDKSMLEAALNAQEFRIREKDFGSFPRGIVFAMMTLESWLYGGDPAQNLSYGESFSELREALSGNYFEALVSELILKNEHKAILTMLPDETLGDTRAKEEKARLAKIKQSLTAEELDEIIEIAKNLKEWQQLPDTPEAIATIPTLEISDISDKIEKIPCDRHELDGVTVLSHDIATAGIVYGEIYFDVSDITKEELFELRMLTTMTMQTATERRSALELQNLIKKELGSFDIRMLTLTRDGEAKIYLVASFSALESKKAQIVDIIGEVLYESKLSDLEVMRKLTRQMKMASEEGMVSGGHAIGINRSAAAFSAEAAINEYYAGYEANVSIKAFDKDFDEQAPALAQKLPSLAQKLYTRERMTLSLVGTPNFAFESAIIGVIKHGETVNPVCNIAPIGKRREGIVIPAQVAYAEVSYSLRELGERTKGSFGVVRNLLSFGYLWGAVRVQGGAYGVGLVARNNGNIGYYSYRDPSPARSIGCYGGSGEFLREFANSGEDITKFIISAVGDSDPLTTPRLKGSLSATRYLRDLSYEDECRFRREILDTDKAELIRIADILDKVSECGSICIVAGKDKLDECSEIIDTILT